MKRKIICSIIIFCSIALVLLITILFTKDDHINDVTTTKYSIFNSIVKSMSEIDDDEILYIKVATDYINLRKADNAQYENQIGKVLKDDIYLVNDISIGETMYWYFIEDNKGNKGYVASGNEELYIETIVKSKNDKMILSTFTDYKSKEKVTEPSSGTKKEKTNQNNNISNNNEWDSDWDFKYNNDLSVSTFNYFYDDPENILILTETKDGFLLSPSKISFECKNKNSKTVNCNSLNDEYDYTVTVKVEYKGKSKSKSYKLYGKNTPTTQTTTTKSLSNDISIGQTTNYSTSKNPTTTTITTTKTTSTSSKLSVSCNGGKSSTCINNRCGTYVFFEAKGNGGTNPYTYSIYIYGSDGNLITRQDNQKIYLNYKPGTYEIVCYVIDKLGFQESSKSKITIN